MDPLSTQLFRQEAVAYRSVSSDQTGEPIGAIPPMWSHVTWLIAAFVFSLLVFLFSVSVPRKETVQGWLRFDGAEAQVHAIEPGAIANVFVKEGDQVEAGQPLLEVRSDRVLSNDKALSEQSLIALARERGGLQAEFDATVRASSLESRTADLAENDALRRETQLAAQRALVKERLSVAERRRDEIASLRESGLVAEPVLNEREEAIAALRQLLMEIDTQIGDTRSGATRARAETQKALELHAASTAVIEQRMAQVDAQMDQARASAAHIVRSPQRGWVAALAHRSGETVEPNTPVAIVLPEDAALIAELYLPSKAAGFVKPGQRVNLRYDAFPYQKFGMAKGVIASVAAVPQPRGDSNATSASPDLFYRVKVSLDTPDVQAFGQTYTLQTGMALTAEIITEERKLIEWLSEPILLMR